MKPRNHRQPDDALETLGAIIATAILAGIALIAAHDLGWWQW